MDKIKEQVWDQVRNQVEIKIKKELKDESFTIKNRSLSRYRNKSSM